MYIYIKEKSKKNIKYESELMLRAFTVQKRN